MKTARPFLRIIAGGALALAIIMTIVLVPDSTSGDDNYGAPVVSQVDLQWLVNGRRPIWMGPVIRYTLYQKATVEARVYALNGELVLVLPVGEQEPGQHTLPWDGTSEGGLVMFEGKYYFELFVGEEFGATFWFTSRRLHPFDEES